MRRSQQQSIQDAHPAGTAGPSFPPSLASTRRCTCRPGAIVSDWLVRLIAKPSLTPICRGPDSECDLPIGGMNRPFQCLVPPGHGGILQDSKSTLEPFESGVCSKRGACSMPPPPYLDFWDIKIGEPGAYSVPNSNIRTWAARHFYQTPVDRWT